MPKLKENHQTFTKYSLCELKSNNARYYYRAASLLKNISKKIIFVLRFLLGIYCYKRIHTKFKIQSTILTCLIQRMSVIYKRTDGQTLNVNKIRFLKKGGLLLATM